MVAPDVGAPETRIIDGVTDSFANVELLLKTKRSIRDKDSVDRRFLAAVRAQRQDGA